MSSIQSGLGTGGISMDIHRPRQLKGSIGEKERMRGFEVITDMSDNVTVQSSVGGSWIADVDFGRMSPEDHTRLRGRHEEQDSRGALTVDQEATDVGVLVEETSGIFARDGSPTETRVSPRGNG
jgi:hypothetical protein